MKLKVNPTFHDLLPPKSDEEKAALEAQLVAEGIREPIVYWAETGDILDGHNRYEIAQNHELNYATKRLSFAHEEQAVEWIVQNQLNRRNLTDEQRRYFIGKLYLKAKESEKPHGEALEGDTAKAVAKQAGVSRATVQRAANFAKAVDAAAPEDKKKILAGKAKAPKPPKKKTKNGSEKIRIPEFMADWGKMSRWIDKLAAAYGVLTRNGNTKYTDEITSLDKKLKEWKDDFLAYQKELAKPQPEGEK